MHSCVCLLIRSYHSLSWSRQDLIARLREERDAAQQQIRAEQDMRTQLQAECAAHVTRIRQLEGGIEQGADHIASLELQVQTLQDDMDGGAAASSAEITEIARQINSGAADVGDVVLVEWNGRHWVVTNSKGAGGAQPTRLSAGVGDQLALDKEKVHLVRVVFRDDHGALVVEGI